MLMIKCGMVCIIYNFLNFRRYLIIYVLPDARYMTPPYLYNDVVVLLITWLHYVLVWSCTLNISLRNCHL